MSNTITREQFSSAVASAISSVHHLYREVDRLLIGLRDRLAEEPDGLIPVRGTFAKAGRDQTRLIIRNEYGALFAPTVSEDEGGEEEEEEDDELEGDDIEDQDGDAKPRKRAPAEIASNVPLFALRIVMYDPQKRESLEPEIQYAVMNEWTVGKGSWSPEHRFLVRRSMLRRIPKALGYNLSVSRGEQLITTAAVKSGGSKKKGGDARLGCRLPAGVQRIPLYTLDSAEALDNLVQGMKAMWSETLSKK